jgi:hypothetical protein
MQRAAPVARAVGLAIVLIAGPACDDQLIRLGSTAPIPFHFGAPTLVPELASSSRTDNPTLTADLLEIYFTTNRDSATAGDVWCARRASPADPFGTPAPVSGVNSDTFETSSAIARDGLTLWFGSDRPGGTGEVDIWESRRDTRDSAWSAPMNLVGLNTTAADIPRPTGLHDLVMPMASTKVTPKNQVEGNYQTYWASRPNLGAPFATPVAIPELDFQDRSTVDGFLTDDGLTFFFSSSPRALGSDGGGAGALDAGPDADAGVPSSDLFVAFRRHVTEPFTVTQPLTDLNTAYDERDPWLSPDGKVFYFTSDRDGVLNIYVASVAPR